MNILKIIGGFILLVLVPWGALVYALVGSVRDGQRYLDKATKQLDERAHRFIDQAKLEDR